MVDYGWFTISQEFGIYRCWSCGNKATPPEEKCSYCGAEFVWIKLQDYDDSNLKVPSYH